MPGSPSQMALKPGSPGQLAKAGSPAQIAKARSPASWTAGHLTAGELSKPGELAKSGSPAGAPIPTKMATSPLAKASSLPVTMAGSPSQKATDAFQERVRKNMTASPNQQNLGPPAVAMGQVGQGGSLPSGARTPPGATPRMPLADEGTADHLPTSRVSTGGDIQAVLPVTLDDEKPAGSPPKADERLLAIQMENRRHMAVKQQAVMEEIGKLHTAATTPPPEKVEEKKAVPKRKSILERRSTVGLNRSSTIGTASGGLPGVPEHGVMPAGSSGLDLTDPAMLELVKGVVADQLDESIRHIVKDLVQETLLEEFSILEAQLEQSLVCSLTNSIRIRIAEVRKEFWSKVTDQEAFTSQMQQEILHLHKLQSQLADWSTELNQDHEQLKGVAEDVNELRGHVARIGGKRHAKHMKTAESNKWQQTASSPSHASSMSNRPSVTSAADDSPPVAQRNSMKSVQSAAEERAVGLGGEAVGLRMTKVKS